MRISVFGLGYVGSVCAACLAQEGHEIIGVDIDQNKVDIINSGKSLIIDREIDEITKKVVENNRLKATKDAKYAIKNSVVSLICVGTPSNDDGSINLDYISSVCKDIGLALAETKDFHVVVVRSTILPRTTEKVIIPTLEKFSKKKVDIDFSICVNPEFLREGTSVYDFYNPPMTVIGESNRKSGDIVESIFEGLKAPVIRTTLRNAEIIKYVNNAFHALKISFANEIGNICKKEGIDSHKVMEIFCLDTKLNLSPYYLKPGFAFGGSCLPKDLRAVIHEGIRNGLSLPLLESILESNENQIERVIDLIFESGKKKVAILGLSFKAGTDDLRESPMVKLVKRLIDLDFNVLIYDQNVSIEKIFGANKKYIEKEIPQISSLMCSSYKQILEKSDVVVVGNQTDEFKKIVQMMNANQILIDLVRIVDSSDKIKSNYHGICW